METAFDNIYKEDTLGFRGKAGFDYGAVANFLEFDHNDISKIATVSKSSVRFDDKIPKAVRDRLDEIANVCLMVAGHFDGDAHKTALWFRAKNPLLGNVSPRDMIRFGRYKKLMQFVSDALQHGKAPQTENKRTQGT